MDLQIIIKNTLKYPFTDIKNTLILGIIFFIGFFVVFTSLFSNGYFLRIIKSSLDGESKPPKFDNWFRMFIDGLKVYVVTVGYSLPLFLIFLIFIGIFIFYSHIVPNYLEIVSSLTVFAVIAILYVIVIIPIFLMALVRMVHNGELNAAFEFCEILNKIRSLGWKNFIKWYLITIIPALAITIGALFLGSIISNIIHIQQFIFLIAFILAPIFMYISRSATLFYLSGNLGYLVCEECGGYYELEPGESPEDYEQCQCGGKLKYTKSISSKNLISDNPENLDKNNKTKSSTNYNKKRNLIIIGILTFIILAIPIIYSTHALTQTPPKYTLLGSYNASNIDTLGTVIIMPQGTRYIKIDYNIMGNETVGPKGLTIETYNIIAMRYTPTNLNMLDDKGVTVTNGQIKTGTMYFNNPEIKSVLLSGNAINGTIKIYTSQ